MNEDKLAELLGLNCQVTCGCGNLMIKSKGITSYKDWILGCRPFDEHHAHPQQVAIPKNCQLLKDHHMIEQLKEYYNNNEQFHTCKIGFPNNPEIHCSVCDSDFQKKFKELLDGCEFCWDPENTGYDYDVCPKCGREL